MLGDVPSVGGFSSPAPRVVCLSCALAACYRNFETIVDLSIWKKGRGAHGRATAHVW